MVPVTPASDCSDALDVYPRIPKLLLDQNQICSWITGDGSSTKLQATSRKRHSISTVNRPNVTESEFVSWHKKLNEAVQFESFAILPNQNEIDNEN
jgi:hypothetical protein